MHNLGSLDQFGWLGFAGEAEVLWDGVRLIPAGTRDHIIVETDSQELASL
jgi:hypothetical protein